MCNAFITNTLLLWPCGSIPRLNSDHAEQTRLALYSVSYDFSCNFLETNESRKSLHACSCHKWHHIAYSCDVSVDSDLLRWVDVKFTSSIWPTSCLDEQASRSQMTHYLRWLRRLAILHLLQRPWTRLCRLVFYVRPFLPPNSSSGPQVCLKITQLCLYF